MRWGRRRRRKRKRRKSRRMRKRTIIGKGNEEGGREGLGLGEK